MPTKMNSITLLSFVCAFLLLLAVAKMPSGYYTFLRLVISICCTAIIIQNIKTLPPVWLVFFVSTFLLFNPLMPVYFYKKSLWLFIDIVEALIFAVYGFRYEHLKKT